MELGQLLNLDRRYDFIRHQCAVNHRFGQGLAHLRHRHGYRGGAQSRQQFVGLAGGCTQLSAFEVGHRLDGFGSHVKYTIAMHMQRDQFDVLELGRHGRVLRHIVPQGLAGAFGALHHERQLKHLGQGEAASRVARQHPDDVSHAVFHLVKQLRWRAAQLHGRVNLALHLVARIGGNLVAPGLNEHLLCSRSGRQKVVYLEGDRLGRSSHSGRSQRSEGQNGFD